MDKSPWNRAPSGGGSQGPEEWPPAIGLAQWQGTRKTQNDVIGISDYDPVRGEIMVMADGIGVDTSAGEAAAAAADAIYQEFQRQTGTMKMHQQVLAMLGAAHARLLQMNEQAAARGEMPVGASVACALIRHRKLSFGSVGNARIFLVREGRMLQLSRDHLLSLEAEERDILAGEAPDLDPEWAMRVTAYAGMENLKRMDWQQTPVSLKTHDQVILISSGLYGVLPEQRMTELLSGCPLQEAAERVIEEVKRLHQPSQSNISLAVMQMGSLRRRPIPVSF